MPIEGLPVGEAGVGFGVGGGVVPVWKSNGGVEVAREERCLPAALSQLFCGELFELFS